ncbi:MAG: phosphotransferase [Anaerolineaceae bacterium]|nr:phosphotransferase [Anaerolineaceae bacterium]
MKQIKVIGILFICIFFALFMYGCASAAPAAEAPAAEEAAAEESAAEEAAAEEPAEANAPTTVLPTQLPVEIESTQQQPTPASTKASAPTATARPTDNLIPVLPVVENRLVELEWPSTMRFGESDIVRMSLVPDEEGYQVTAEFPDHSTQTQTIIVKRSENYLLYGIARLDGAGFEIAPNQDQKYILPENETVHWRWSIAPESSGQQRLSISLVLRWEPEPGTNGLIRESLAFSRALNIQVKSVLGMKQSQAISISFVGLFAGSIMTLSGVVMQGNRRKRKSVIDEITSNADLAIELVGKIKLSTEDSALLCAMFEKHARVIVENEFLSGYSGARTFLVRPIFPDGKQDAQTIVKMGARSMILQEYENYEQFVKDRLPPITARIQRLPMSVPKSSQAALQYTFLAEPGQSPLSLRKALLQEPQTLFIRQLFDTFSPYWWLQRSPYTFRMAQEYDAILPPHLILEPIETDQKPEIFLSADITPDDLNLQPGQIIQANTYKHAELRADGNSLSISGYAIPGKPRLRIRWLSATPPNKTKARVIHTRESYLQAMTSKFSLNGLPNPLENLNATMQKTVNGAKSIIHGDLNLENILVGPGALVWLIDFAQTGEGHSLRDFAHLYMEIIAHVLSARGYTAQEFVQMIETHSEPLLAEIEQIARRCQLDVEQDHEFDLAAGITCLGAIKFETVPEEAKQYLFLAAAYLLSR